MRFLFSLLTGVSISLHALAAEQGGKQFSDAPPPPAMSGPASEEDLEPQVTIVQKKDMVVEEYRVAGKLYKIKVIPKVGPPYYLVDESGTGEFTRHDGPDGANMRPPRWVIFSF